MPRPDQSSSQMMLVAMCVGMLSALASLGHTADTASLTTRPEDPLQPVWSSLDAIPAQVLAGFKGQIESLSRSSEASLLTVRTRLSTLEANLKQEIETLGEDTDDLVANRLVNTETLICENINKLAETLTALTQKCDLCAVAVQSHQETQESTRCSDQAASAMERMEATVARVEAAAIKVDRAAERVDETAVKVDEVARKVDEIATRMEELKAGINAGATRVEEVAARVEEMAARVEEATLRVEEAASKVHLSAVPISGVTAPTTTTRPSYYPLDCADIHWRQPEAPSKVYLTYPTLEPQAPVSAFCDMGLSEAKETGGWTVVLRRQNTSWGMENFNRSWVEYSAGFGEPGKGEWWYGLAPLHALTFRQQYEAVFLLHDIERGTFTATYTTFRVENEDRAFRLAVDGFSGNVSHDALSAMHHGRPFSTYDKDNDGFSTGNCAANNGGGWWYERCHRATLTATFPEGPDREARTIRWNTPELWLVLDDVMLKIRPANYSQRFTEYADGE